MEQALKREAAKRGYGEKRGDAYVYGTMRKTGWKPKGEKSGSCKPKKASSGKPGLYANINAKRKRIAAGSGEKMRKPGTKGAPTAKAFRESAKTAKNPQSDGTYAT